uniref:VQ domain-containing protein n=1 Tax=Fagus sylvatica TaxID=28930 RepID=A0A2N9EDP4_FAGSY
MGKNIRKSPLHQPNFANNPARQQPQPQVYNISKNDFRNIVQQLTGSPSQEPLPRPPNNPPKPQSMRLQRIRPPPLTPIHRPHIPPPVPVHAAPPPMMYNNSFARPGQFGQPSPTPLQQLTPGDSNWANTAESPITAYMRYLQNSIMDPGPRGNPTQPQLQQVPGQIHAQPHSTALLPNPHMPAFPSPRMNGPPPPMPSFPSPQMNGPGLLPSPTSQFLLPSPTGYLEFEYVVTAFSLSTVLTWDSVSFTFDTQFRISTHGSIGDFRSRASTSTFTRPISFISFRVFSHLKSKMEESIILVIGS